VSFESLQLRSERNSGSYAAFTTTLENFRTSAAVFTATIDLFI